MIETEKQGNADSIPAKAASSAGAPVAQSALPVSWSRLFRFETSDVSQGRQYTQTIFSTQSNFCL